jgi:hypothetical protein
LRSALAIIGVTLKLPEYGPGPKLTPPGSQSTRPFPVGLIGVPYAIPPLGFRAHDVFVKERSAPRVDHVDFGLSVGTAVPRSVRIVAVPLDDHRNPADMAWL